ncbi:MAG: peptide ABC transporter substrate-binding protein [Verrucomicrobia bacterium]|nr:peptide ABC transporter substrate-binding protein [Verrucomicrobiota bacterium]
MKRMLLPLLFLLTACSSDQDAKEERILHLSIQTPPLSLDPAVGGDRRTQVVTNMLFEGLTRIGPSGKVELALAKEVEISPDGLLYTFHLRPSLWSDGTPCTAGHFEYAFKRAVDPQFVTRFAFAFFPILGAKEANLGKCSLDEVQVKAIDDCTLQVRLAHPAPYYLDLLAIPVCRPLKPGLPQGWDKQAATYLANGPFMLAHYQPDQEIFVVKNPNYWQADQVHLDGIKLAIVCDGNTAMQMFERGELDWVGAPMGELPKPAMEDLLRQGNLTTSPVTGVYGFNFNTEASPFNSLKVRQAFALALDRQQLIDCVRKGKEPLATSLLPVQLTLCEGFKEAQDPELACQLFEEGLQELGLSRETLPPIKLSYAMLEGELAMVQAVQQQWSSLFEVPIELCGYEYRAYLTALIVHDYQIGGMTWWSWFADPVYILEMMYARSYQFNASGWEDPIYQSLVDQANQTPDAAERHRCLQQAEQILLDQMLFLPLHAATHKYSKRPEVAGVVLSELGAVDFRYAQKIEPASSIHSQLPKLARSCADALP